LICVTKRKVIGKVVKGLKGYGLVVEIDYDNCEILSVKRLTIE